MCHRSFQQVEICKTVVLSRRAKFTDSIKSCIGVQPFVKLLSDIMVAKQKRGYYAKIEAPVENNILVLVDACSVRENK
jgi:hypothetical protein